MITKFDLQMFMKSVAVMARNGGTTLLPPEGIVFISLRLDLLAFCLPTGLTP